MEYRRPILRAVLVAVLLATLRGLWVNARRRSSNLPPFEPTVPEKLGPPAETDAVSEARIVA